MNAKQKALKEVREKLENLIFACEVDNVSGDRIVASNHPVKLAQYEIEAIMDLVSAIAKNRQDLA